MQSFRWNPIHWGIGADHPIPLQLRIRLANAIALSLTIVFVLVSFLTPSLYVRTAYYMGAGFFLVVPLLHLLGLDKLGRLLVSLTGAVVFLYVGTSPKIRDLDREQFYRLFIFGQVFVPLAVFSSRELFYQIVGAGLAILAYFLYPVIDPYHTAFAQFPPTNRVITNLLLQQIGPGILFTLVTASYLYFQWQENQATQAALEREQEANQVLRAREAELAAAVEQHRAVSREASATAEALKIQYKATQKQADRLEEARGNMRRLIKRLRTGQVQLEEQQGLLAERQFVDAGLAQLAQEARHQPSLTLSSWADNVLQAISSRLEIADCSLYLREGDQLVALAQHNIRQGLAEPRFSLGEGTVGAAAQSGHPILTAWPQVRSNGNRIATSLFSVHPTEIFTLPVRYNNEVLAVVEVMCLGRVEPRQRAYLIRTPEVLGPSLHAFLAQLEIQKLLKEAQAKAERLLNQEEKLHQNIEELEATQERMRLTQDLLLQQEASLQAVLNATHDSITLVDREYRLVIANEPMRARYRSYGIELKIGARTFDMMPNPADAALWQGIYDTAFGGQPQIFNGTRTEEGVLRYVEYSVNPVYDSHKVIIGASVFSRDVTERVNAENAIRESEARLRELNETLEDQVALRTQEVSLNASILETTLDTTLDGFVVSDTQGRILRYNRQFVAMWQLSPEEESAFRQTESLLQLLPRIPKPDAEIFRRHVRQIQADNPPYTELVLHTDSERLFRVFSRQPVENNSEVGRVWGFTDITELHRSELRFRRFFELANEGLVFHTNGIITDMNPSIANMFGVSLSESIGTNVLDFIHPEDTAIARSFMASASEQPYELRVVTRSGKILTCEIVARNLEIDGRKIRAVAVRDITERLQAENQFISIARANPIPLLLFRYSDGSMLYANQHFERMLGYNAAEVEGTSTKVLYYYEEDKPRLRDLLRVTGGRVENVEVCARKSTGEPVWVVVSSERVQFRGEDAIIITFYDITERRAFEQNLLEAKQQVEAAYAELRTARDQLALSEKLASLGQIIAGVAHEINTPVAAVGSSAQFLQEGMPASLRLFAGLLIQLPKKEAKLLIDFVGALYAKRRLLSSREERGLRKELLHQLEETRLASPEEASRMLVEVGFQHELTPFIPLLSSRKADQILETVYRVGQNFHTLENLLVAAEKTRTIVGALKRFTHLGQQGGEEKASELRPISLADNLNTILILYAHQIRQTALLTTQFEGDLYAVADADRLGQVWTNLITNALQAMPNGGELTVELLDGQLDGVPRPERVLVRVTDTGTGIPEQVLPRIFDPFFTTKPKGEGTGIGLHISRQIIENFGGTISVASRPGQTQFLVDLPKASPHAT